MITLVKQNLHQEPYDKQEILEILGVSADELNQISLSERTRDRKCKRNLSDPA